MSERRPAWLGGTPCFDRPVPVGQLYFPDWETYVLAMRGIFERQYYTNQGPMARRFEQELQRFFGVEHAICVTNATIGLMMAAEALGLRGKVLVPSFTFIATVQSLRWCGLEPVFCDVDRDTHHLTTTALDTAWTPDVTAVLGVNLWGNAADVAAIDAWARDRGIASYWDSAQALGCEVDGRRLGGRGRLEVFSLHATKIVNATEGGCITTNDDELAKRLRNIRSSYGAGPPVSVVKTSNGRMSEFQATIGSLSLQAFDRNRTNNAMLLGQYQTDLDAISGIQLVARSGVSRSNCQYAVATVDPGRFGMTRDTLLDALNAENILARRYFHPGGHKTIPFDHDGQPLLANTDFLCERVIQLPLGAHTSQQTVREICHTIANLREHVDAIAG
ncbi:MAG: DegT/DnrJ/EryC1/StrS family aminotransferase [Chromatiaceae bacterium]|nr:DegT/DnrJ/EryC1/StrS family aminotransferase [Chromatiaceae bacterium]MCP5422285.1 DegT/DnrJ/EryC1/StrS family aminotransferase [Chromatiaceae bacterium]